MKAEIRSNHTATDGDKQPQSLTQNKRLQKLCNLAFIRHYRLIDCLYPDVELGNETLHDSARPSIEEAEEPQWQFVAMGHLGVVAGKEHVVGGFGAAWSFTHAHFGGVIDFVEAFAALFVDGVVSPKWVDKECLHDELLAHLRVVDGIEQVGVVEHDAGRLFGECFAFAVDHIDEAGFFEILQVVHHCGAAGADDFGHTADVGRRAAFDCEHIEQAFEA